MSEPKGKNGKLEGYMMDSYSLFLKRGFFSIFKVRFLRTYTNLEDLITKGEYSSSLGQLHSRLCTWKSHYAQTEFRLPGKPEAALIPLPLGRTATFSFS